MLILPRLEVPQVPLTSGDALYDLESVNSYLHSLVGYFYSCNAPLADSVLGVNAGSAKYTEGTFQVTATGFSGTPPTSNVEYVQTGKQTTLVFSQINSTSNATTFTLTGLLPSLAAITTTFIVIPIFDASGIGINGMIQIDSTTTCTLYTNAIGGAWTPSGAKGFQPCAITYISI